MRIYSIDLLKFIFAWLVVFAHMDINYPGASVAVDFFFVFSGFFLAKKFYSKSAENPQEYNQFRYTADHVKKLYPQYVFSLLVMLGYLCGRDLVRIVSGSELAGSIGATVFRVFEAIPDIFMIQDMGYFVGGGINTAAWYVSTLVIVGYFIYAMLCYDQRKTSEFVLPVLFILTCAYMKFGRHNFDVYGALYIPIVRCVQYMSEGVIIYRIFKSKAFAAVRNGSLLFNLAGIMGIASLFAMERYKNIHLVLFAFVVLYTSCPESWINKVVKGKVFRRIGDMSYAVYLNHAVVIMAMEDIFRLAGITMEHTQFAWVAAAVIFVYSVFTMLLLDRLTPWFTQKFIPALRSRKIV
jgi:peptidoglycan/LPS O-acetylase OafA/YrhL